MPDPNDYDNKEEFMDECIPQVIEEGTAEDGSQAFAICNSMWNNKSGRGI